MSAGFSRLRRRLALGGGRPAHAPAESVHGRRDEAEYRPATLVESPLRHIAVGAPEAWHDDVAFLDGTQHAELIGYGGTQPLLAAVVRAAVRLRHDRRMTLAADRCRRLVIGRRVALEHLADCPPEFDTLCIEDDEEPHPVRDLQAARALVDRARGGLEIEVARDFRLGRPEQSEGRPWLIVDGSLAASPDWAHDDRMLGVVKSHAMLPFMGAELETYLTLPAGHRSSVFMPASRQLTPLYAWALRLHDCTGRDLFHGLVRIEAPATEATLARADELSRFLLAERAPLSNDPRADRLLYGIHDVERYLGAQAP